MLSQIQSDVPDTDRHRDNVTGVQYVVHYAGHVTDVLSQMQEEMSQI